MEFVKCINKNNKPISGCERKSGNFNKIPYKPTHQSGSFLLAVLLSDDQPMMMLKMILKLFL